MLSAVLVEPFRIELVDRELRSLRPTDVLVEVTQCGVCTSDIDLWSGKSSRQLPVSIGHEPAGVVIDVGRDVKNLKPGCRVGVWVEGGGFSEQIVAEERFCIPVDGNCPYPAMAEPLGCVVNAVQLAAPALADDIVIVGAGFMGNLIQLVTQLKGPHSITVADIRPEALERAARLGARHTVDASSVDLAQFVSEITDGRGADVSFEVTGANEGLHLTGSATRMSGKLCIVGYHQGGMREIPLGHWNWMAFNIINAHFREAGTILSGMRAGIRLMMSGALDVAPLVSHTYPLERIDEAFKIASVKPDGFVKAVIERKQIASEPASPPAR